MAKYPRGNNMAGLLKQAQKMQENMQKAQAEILEMEFTKTAGGGAVSATVGGDKFVKAIKIDPEILTPEDSEMIEDMVLAAINEALREADETTQKKMGAVTGGMNIPGM